MGIDLVAPAGWQCGCWPVKLHRSRGCRGAPSAALGQDTLRAWLGVVLGLVNALSGSLEGEGQELLCCQG